MCMGVGISKLDILICNEEEATGWVTIYKVDDEIDKTHNFVSILTENDLTRFWDSNVLKEDTEQLALDRRVVYSDAPNI